MPSTQSYSVIGPVRQGSVRASLAGARSYCVCQSMHILPVWKYNIGLRVAVSIVGGLEGAYMYKSSGYNDPTAKILCNEECPLRNADSSMSRCVDRERRTYIPVNSHAQIMPTRHPLIFDLDV